MNRTKIGFDVFLYALVVIAGSFLIISGIMAYKIIHDNPVLATLLTHTIILP